jgi:hypothetical protein
MLHAAGASGHRHAQRVGHRPEAREIGIADRTPKLRVSYEASRPPLGCRRAADDQQGRLAAPSGSTERATATKNASASTRRMRRGQGLDGMGKDTGRRARTRASSTSSVDYA